MVALMKRNRKQGNTTPAPENEPTGFDLEGLDLPDEDDAALQSLAALQDEVRAPVITPSRERFPPTNKPERPPQPPQEAPKPKPKTGWNVLTLFALFCTVGLMGWIALVWVNPTSVVNPFPPATPFVQITATPLGFVAPDLPTPNAEGQIVIVATETPRPTSGAPENVGPVYPFTLVEVGYVANENGLGCEWSSIAGSVTDAAGDGLTGFRVRITGNGLNETIFSNTAPAFGPGGFELPLGQDATDAEYVLQLADAQGNPLSESFTLATRSACDSNVVVANFTQN